MSVQPAEVAEDVHAHCDARVAKLFFLTARVEKTAAKYTEERYADRHVMYTQRLEGFLIRGVNSYVCLLTRGSRHADRRKANAAETEDSTKKASVKEVSVPLKDFNCNVHLPNELRLRYAKTFAVDRTRGLQRLFNELRDFKAQFLKLLAVAAVLCVVFKGPKTSIEAEEA